MAPRTSATASACRCCCQPGIGRAFRPVVGGAGLLVPPERSAGLQACLTWRTQMDRKQIVRRCTYALGLLAALGAGGSRVDAQGHDHGADRKDAAGAFVQLVRESTERFKDVAVARQEGYALNFGCVSGPDYGAMGMHFVNFPLVLDGELDPTRPEIVIFEPLPNGRLRLIGADYL